MLCGMSDERMYSLPEVMKAQAALRSAANLPAETFPLGSVIGMFSDEIESLRKQGMDDGAIAAIIRASSAIEVDSGVLGALYATPEQRKR